MSTITEWPNVTALVEGAGLTVPRLDKQPEPYPPEWLRERAERYANDPEMAALLEWLAKYEALNKKLNRTPATLRHQNVALHYQIAIALEPHKKKTDVRERIADLWCITPSHVKDIYTEHGRTVLPWLTNLIMHIYQRADFATHPDILAALDKDMALRAKTVRRH